MFSPKDFAIFIGSSFFLQRMEELLSKFQTDLGSISSEIQYLQDQSHSMSIKLKNRQVGVVCVWSSQGRVEEEMRGSS